jgi:hypothetical protein
MGGIRDSCCHVTVEKVANAKAQPLRICFGAPARSANTGMEHLRAGYFFARSRVARSRLRTNIRCAPLTSVLLLKNRAANARVAALKRKMHSGEWIAMGPGATQHQ